VIQVEEFLAGRCRALSPHSASTLYFAMFAWRRGGAVRTMVACARTPAVVPAAIRDRCHEDLIGPGTVTSAFSLTGRGPAGPCRMPSPHPADQVRPPDSGRGPLRARATAGPGPSSGTDRRHPCGPMPDPLTPGSPCPVSAARAGLAGAGPGPSPPARHGRPWPVRGARRRHLGPRPPPAPARTMTPATWLRVDNHAQGRQS